MATKKNLVKLASWIGKRVDPNKWKLPAGHHLCAQTGRLYPENQLLITFNHWQFERRWLRTMGIWAEDADWLSEDGYDQIVGILEKAGVYSRYVEGEYIGAA